MINWLCLDSLSRLVGMFFAFFCPFFTDPIPRGKKLALRAPYFCQKSQFIKRRVVKTWNGPTQRQAISNSSVYGITLSRVICSRSRSRFLAIAENWD